MEPHAGQSQGNQSCENNAALVGRDDRGGGHGGGLRLESADPRDGTGGGYGAAGVPPGGHRLGAQDSVVKVRCDSLLGSPATLA